MQPSPFGLRGFLIDAPVYGSLRSRRDGALVVADGKIAEIGDYDDLRKRQRAEPIPWLNRGTVAIFPGLIDCHAHLPQYSAVARGESQLLPWLRENIFPVEREFTGPKAREESPLFFTSWPATERRPPCFTRPSTRIVAKSGSKPPSKAACA